MQSIYDFITKYVKKYNSVQELLEKGEQFISDDDLEELKIYQNVSSNSSRASSRASSKASSKAFSKSKKGFVYERLWDICIKFGITDLTTESDLVEHCFGNMNDTMSMNNNGCIEMQYKITDYLEQNFVSGNTGGYSDISFITSKEGKRTLNLVSVKYIKETSSIDKYDIQNLCTIIRENENLGYNDFKVLLFVKDKKKFIQKAEASHQSSKILLKYININGNYENVYDANDLNNYYMKLKYILGLYNYNIAQIKNQHFKAIQNKKELFIPRFHQQLFIEKIMQMIRYNKVPETKVLVGAIPRTGKTYIMAGTILEDVKGSKPDKDYRKYVIITPAPTETIQQYVEVFENHIDFVKHNIHPVVVDKDIDKYNFANKSNTKHHIVYIISKQRLGYSKINVDKSDIIDLQEDKILKIRDNIRKYLGNGAFNIIFMDEAHYGMSTFNCKMILDILDIINTPKIYVSGTYNKPVQAYNIQENQKITWNINDIQLIKELQKGNYASISKVFASLSAKFGKSILYKVLKSYGWKHKIDDIAKEIKYNSHIIYHIRKSYTSFPEPFLITSVWEKDFITKEKDKIDDAYVGFDMDTLFKPKTDKFENEEQVKEILHYYFGYPDKNKMYSEQHFYKERGILPRIERICNNRCRTLQSNHKSSQLWFLPYGQGCEIKKVVVCLLRLLVSSFTKVFNKYVFFIALQEKEFKNETDICQLDNVKFLQKPENIKEEIKQVEKELSDSDKDGLIILAGGRLQLGISLKNVDIVALFTNVSSSDAIYQMMFRSMTEINGIDGIDACNGNSYCPAKKYGFIVDLNPQRTLLMLNYFANEMQMNKKKHEDIRKNIAKLINIDRDVIIDRYSDSNDNDKFYDELFSKLHNAWNNRVEKLGRIIEELEYNEDLLRELENNQDILNFQITKEDNPQKEVIQKPQETITGKKYKFKEIFKFDSVKKKKEQDIKELLNLITAEVVSLLIVLTSYTDDKCIFKGKNTQNFEYEMTKLLHSIDTDSTLKGYFLHSIRERILLKSIQLNDDTLMNIIKTIISMRQSKNVEIKGGNLITLDSIIYHKKKQIYDIKEPDKLLKFISDNLKPKDIEKKTRGEVFTPMELVNQMLDKLPIEIWKKKNYKWLDPCAGMGNFPVAVYMRLMKGLKDVIKDEEKRRKHILENMLYMVEIDKKNVFIMKKVLCGNTYKINVFEGSFFDYKTDMMFDVVVGNPPYQNTDTEGNRRALLNNLWSLFIEKSFNELLKKNGYLVFITPVSWMTPGYKNKDIFYNHHILFLNIGECDKWFNVGSTFSYYIINKSNQKKDTEVICKYNNKIYESSLYIANDTNFLPNLLTKEGVAIVNKFYKNKILKISFSQSGELHHFQKKHLIGECDKRFIYPVRHTTKHTNLCSSVKHSMASKQKILMNISGYLDPIYDTGKLGITEAQMYYLTANRKYVDILKHSKLYLFIFDICKWSGFNTLSIFKNIPYIEKFTSNEDIYRLFKLTKAEIKLIEDIIS